MDTMLPGRFAAATMNESWYGLRLKFTCTARDRCSNALAPVLLGTTVHAASVAHTTVAHGLCGRARARTCLNSEGIQRMRPYQPKLRVNQMMMSSTVVHRIFGWNSMDTGSGFARLLADSTRRLATGGFPLRRAIVASTLPAWRTLRWSQDSTGTAREGKRLAQRSQRGTGGAATSSTHVVGVVAWALWQHAEREQERGR